MEQIKCVVVGDGGVGKTSLLITYTKGSFPEEYIPTIFDNYSTSTVVDGKPDCGIQQVRMITIGFDLSYPNADVFLVCFSLVCPTSFENVRNKWHPELSYSSPNTPVVLVGMKEDLWSDSATISILKQQNLAPITFHEGKQLQKEIQAVGYVECSAISMVGMKEVFESYLGAK